MEIFRITIKKYLNTNQQTTPHPMSSQIEKPKTIFCDIDGTLVYHYGDIVSNYQEPAIVLPNVLESIKSWEKNNYKIILTTGRKECVRTITEEQLSDLGIVYDCLIMGLPNGDRVLINDRKPNSLRNTAYAINLDRNIGFENVFL
jgi:3-deoxy-D-manno-octulosonate 8-phosphate phosphatase KdsC-like HAD superfamily phosphatase